MLTEEEDEIRGHLFDMARFLFEEESATISLSKSGAKIDGNYFIFTANVECADVFAINPFEQVVFKIGYPNQNPISGELIADIEEIICIISGLVEFVEESLGDHFPQREIFMARFNPQNYKAGDCFSPC